MTRILLALGSNRGDRAAHLSFAVKALGRTEGCRVRKASRLYETAPVGAGDRAGLHQAVILETTRTPMGLLIAAKCLEAEAGRRPGQRGGACVLDIDLIAYGTRKLRTPWLRVPHPGAARRAFVLAPLAEISPSWRPDGRRSVRDLLAALKPDPGIVRIWPHGR